MDAEFPWAQIPELTAGQLPIQRPAGTFRDTVPTPHAGITIHLSSPLCVLQIHSSPWHGGTCFMEIHLHSVSASVWPFSSFFHFLFCLIGRGIGSRRGMADRRGGKCAWGRMNNVPEVSDLSFGAALEPFLLWLRARDLRSLETCSAFAELLPRGHKVALPLHPGGHEDHHDHYHLI